MAENISIFLILLGPFLNSLFQILVVELIFKKFEAAIRKAVLIYILIYI